MSTDESYPKYFYKYRAIENAGDLRKDYAIDALLNNQAIFSSRRNFNDIFDSKVELIKPTPKQLKSLKNAAGKEEKRFIDRCIHNGNFTAEGLYFISGIKSQINQIIDSYAFFSVSKNPTSNLMWSHYAKNHTGFCIEFKSEHIQAEKVSYQENVRRIHMLELIRYNFKLTNETDFGKQVWTALRTKLKEWDYEDEYRFQASKSMGQIPRGENFIKIPYPPDWIESIIFGIRMDDKVKEFIAKNMPCDMRFKQAKERTSTIDIVPWERS